MFVISFLSEITIVIKNSMEVLNVSNLTGLSDSPLDAAEPLPGVVVPGFLSGLHTVDEHEEGTNESAGPAFTSIAVHEGHIVNVFLEKVVYFLIRLSWI